ncbi:membrane protein [Streptomyces sp. AS58]|uniref:endolytic transglycosylase MltG n=1 Tax=Streptomyces sp. AS58 TaxID=1519489 RepID=UPI0006AF1A58|nr:endolytic transglycosylase MltG [Streptomyces sp. AS58]KOV49508.1 membrane protein [Streptomyces sp. AS58]
MTEYGRGPGSEPWHPQDPLFGDGGWGGQQAQAGQQLPYGDHPQQWQYGDWGPGEHPGYGHAQQYDQQQYAAQAQQSYGTQQQYDTGSWATGTQVHLQYAADPTDLYSQQGVAPGTEQRDFYGTPDVYPPPEPPSRRRTEPEPETDWDPGPDQGEHAFFSGEVDSQDEEPTDRRGRVERRGRGGKGKKSRNGGSRRVAALVFGGGMAGVVYLGYQFYPDRFGVAPDFAGGGNGEAVTVTIPEGAGGYEIGGLLKKAGVVKSVDAFVAAQNRNPEGKGIHSGVYALQQEMSADSAIERMLNLDSINNLIIAEGKRNTDIYKLIDKRLEVADGTTAAIAKKEYRKLGLPDWALNQENVKDPLEGFLYPSSYAAAKGQTPQDVLKQMVSRATSTYTKLGVEKKAEELGLDGPWQLLTVASLVQAEGTSHDDFRRMAEVVYNRLDRSNPQTNGMLEFDSTYNYIKNQSKIDLSLSELRNYDNPYNTYYNRGLPPGPISNPGDEALKGALDPTDEGWYYFISLNGKTSEFTRTNEEHQQLVDEWNATRGN